MFPNTTGPLSQERRPADSLAHSAPVFHILFFDPMVAKPRFLCFFKGSIAGEWTSSKLFLLAILVLSFLPTLFFLSVEPPELWFGLLDLVHAYRHVGYF